MSRMKFSRPTRKTLMQWMLIILAIFAIRIWQQQDLAHGMVPSFTSKTLTGEILSATPTTDEAILVHFWATWCKVCHFENANIQSIANDYKTLNIAIQSGSNHDIATYAKANDLKLDNIINDASGSLSKLFGVRGTPSSFIINPQGNIQFIEVGYSTEIGLRLRLWWASL